MNTIREDTGHRHPIGLVTRRTGLSQSLLRAWERRYSAVVPKRSEGGQRLYSDADLERLGLLRDVVDAGWAIGQVAGLANDELRELLKEERRFPGPDREGTGWQGAERRSQDADDRVDDAIQAVVSSSPSALQRSLERAAAVLEAAELVDDFLLPLLHRIGVMWEQGGLSSAEERLASGVIASLLHGLIQAVQPDGDRPEVVVGTPAGEQHELGALIAGLVAAAEGWRVIPLGPNLPAADMAAVVQRQGVSMVALSVLHPFTSEDEVEMELLRLRALLRPEIELVVGGTVARKHRDVLIRSGIEVLDDMKDFRMKCRRGSRRSRRSP